jgi:hypothetical protein
MAQHDYNIANQTAADARTDINNVLQAIATNNSGTGVPTATFPNQWFYDTDDQLLKIRNNTTTTYLNVGYIDQTNGFEILDDTRVVNTSGNQIVEIGVLGDQAIGTWVTGTGATESLVSPAKVKAAAEAVVGNQGLGVSQTWQDMTSSRAFNTTYQNTTGRPIFIGVSATVAGDGTMSLLVSPNSDMSSSVTADRTSDIDDPTGVSAIIPNNIYYKASVVSASGLYWAELR